MQFADDPVAWFGDDGAAASAIDPREAEGLQQQALAYRLSQMLPTLPALRAMADVQGLDASLALDEAPRLFFPHSFFKAYDPAWLTGHDFARMTRWMNHQIAADIALPPGADFPTVDAWLDWLEAKYSLFVTHSSGTTDRLSLILRDQGEFVDNHRLVRMMHRDWFQRAGLEMGDMKFHIVWPAPAEGRGAMVRLLRPWREHTAPTPGDYATLFDRDLGTDYELYALEARNAQAGGEQEMAEPSDYVAAMLAEAEARHAGFDSHIARMLDRIADTMPGRQAIAIGGPHTLARLASAAIARGLDGIFAPNSLFNSVGGLKGHGIPDGLAADLPRFMGSDISLDIYGMTEMLTGFMLCPAGRFHVPPWVVVWALDPANGWKPLLRRGEQEGRAAYLDLSSAHGWGGLAAADHIRVNYERCACGRTTPGIARDIKRVADGEGAYGFTPAPSFAIDAALEVLWEGADGV